MRHKVENLQAKNDDGQWAKNAYQARTVSDSLHLGEKCEIVHRYPVFEDSRLQYVIQRLFIYVGGLHQSINLKEVDEDHRDLASHQNKEK